MLLHHSSDSGWLLDYVGTDTRIINELRRIGNPANHATLPAIVACVFPWYENIPGGVRLEIGIGSRSSRRAAEYIAEKLELPLEVVSTL